MFSSLWYYLKFSNSAVKIPDSQAYKIYENDKGVLWFYLWSHRYVVISPLIGFHFVAAAVVFSVLGTTSDFKPWCETTAPSLKLVTVSSVCPFTLISLWMPLALDRTQWSIHSCWADDDSSQVNVKPAFVISSPEVIKLFSCYPLIFTDLRSI